MSLSHLCMCMQSLHLGLCICEAQRPTLRTSQCWVACVAQTLQCLAFPLLGYSAGVYVLERVASTGGRGRGVTAGPGCRDRARSTLQPTALHATRPRRARGTLLHGIVYENEHAPHAARSAFCTAPVRGPGCACGHRGRLSLECTLYFVLISFRIPRGSRSVTA